MRKLHHLVHTRGGLVEAVEPIHPTRDQARRTAEQCGRACKPPLIGQRVTLESPVARDAHHRIIPRSVSPRRASDPPVQGDVTIQPGVARTKHLAHGTFADGRDDFAGADA